MRERRRRNSNAPSSSEFGRFNPRHSVSTFASSASARILQRSQSVLLSRCDSCPKEGRGGKKGREPENAPQFSSIVRADGDVRRNSLETFSHSPDD
jgi:hypothetical protein